MQDHEEERRRRRSETDNNNDSENIDNDNYDQDDSRTTTFALAHDVEQDIENLSVFIGKFQSKISDLQIHMLERIEHLTNILQQFASHLVSMKFDIHRHKCVHCGEFAFIPTTTTTRPLESQN